MKTTDKSYPTGLANLLNGLPAHHNFPTTTTKETTKVKTTPKAKAKPVAVVEAPVVEAVVAVPADLLAVAVVEAIAYDDAVTNVKSALRTACIATSHAVEAGISLRALEQASKTAGAKISKTSFARYAKVGAQLIADPTVDAEAILAKIYAEENKKAKDAKKAKASAETEGAETEDSADDNVVVALTIAEIVAILVEEGAEAIASVVANLSASLQDDHEVFATLAVALLEAGASTAPLDNTERRDLFTVCATTVAVNIGA
jgi:hypothetical protein